MLLKSVHRVLQGFFFFIAGQSTNNWPCNSFDLNSKTKYKMSYLCFDITHYFSFYIILPNIQCLFMNTKRKTPYRAFFLGIRSGDNRDAKKHLQWDEKALWAPNLIKNCNWRSANNALIAWMFYSFGQISFSKIIRCILISSL